MSKKLIAVAAAAALALTGLVATPANATSIVDVTITSGSGASAVTDIRTASHADSDAAVTPNTFAVARNVVFGSTDAATRTAVRFVARTAAAGTVTVDATGGVRLATTIETSGVALKVDAGSQTLTGATATGALNYTFYAWNTSTTAGSVVVKTAGSTLTFYVKGVAGEAYNIVTPTFPASLYIGQTDGKVTYGLTDAYGNNVSTTGVQPTGFGGTFGVSTYSSTTKLHTSKVLTVTADNVAINLAITPIDLSANGFAKPVESAFKLISAGDLADQVTALTAQVTALTAQVADLKADYNKLATRWNKKFANKRTVKKLVALK
jgi:hypothetical protein